jgi:8-oxo-dGTP pyrophosphatase MutT (NUDIX family)
MITFDRDGSRFTYRVAAIMLHDRRVLLHRAESDDFWCLPGGRCELLERSRDTIEREMLEEIGLAIPADRLLWVVENFFDYAGHSCHELGFYYLMEIPEDSSLLARGDQFIGDEGGTELFFRWFSLEDLDAISLYPTFLREGLRSIPQGIAHVMHVDKK